MAYRLVFDSLDVSWVYVPGLLAAFCFLGAALMGLQLWNRRRSAIGNESFTILSPGVSIHLWTQRSTVTGTGQAGGRPSTFLLALTFGIIGLCFVSVEYEAVADQRRSKEWLRAGQYDTVEGVIADCRPSRNGGAHHFRVQGVFFVCDKAGGFRGTFTAPDAPPPAAVLRDGARVRITYHEGHVLRIEIPAS